ncbi:MAG: hypothetical protein Q4G13_09115 [Moraxella sp.]|nr:hypothetical protein [Moraxella sp.]
MKIVMFPVLATVLALTGCGGKGEQVHAVDYTDTAAEQARAKAPKAEEVKFDDHGQPVFAGTITTAQAAQPATATATATAETAQQ